jgi:hypothetical protein
MCVGGLENLNCSKFLFMAQAYFIWHRIPGFYLLDFVPHAKREKRTLF